MKEIRLTHGQVMLVDDADFQWLNQWKWRAVFNSKTYYAERTLPLVGKKQVNVYAHNQISGIKAVDHRDGNGLNNQRFNLRPASPSQNHANAGLWRHNTSGFKGVSWHKRRQKWMAAITVNDQKSTLVIFSLPRKHMPHIAQPPIIISELLPVVHER
jgi:hypothetical protein